MVNFASETNHDPIPPVAGTLQVVRQAARDGASDAQEAAARHLGDDEPVRVPAGLHHVLYGLVRRDLSRRVDRAGDPRGITWPSRA